MAGRKGAAVAAGAVLLVGFGGWWAWSGRSELAPPAQLASPAQREPGVGGQETIAVPAPAAATIATSPSVASSVPPVRKPGPAPAGAAVAERLGQADAAGGPSALLWRGGADGAPLVVLIGEPGVPIEAWQPIVDELRRVRDVHLVAASVRAEQGRDENEILASIDAAIGQARARLGDRAGALGLVGVGVGASAAIRYAVRRGGVRATVAISPTWWVGDRPLDAGIDRLAGHLLVAAASDDPRSDSTVTSLVRVLTRANFLRPAGRLHGFELVAATRSLRTDLYGWLYATLGPAPGGPDPADPAAAGTDSGGSGPAAPSDR